MNLRDTTVKICEELSDKGVILEPTSVNLIGEVQDYYGFKLKKGFHLFRNFPIFKLSVNYGKPTLTSLSREYDKKIEEIAKREDFAYTFEKANQFSAFFK